MLDRQRAKDITVLMGHFNAKIGADNTGYEDIMGVHGLGQMNENVERFANLCSQPALMEPLDIPPEETVLPINWDKPSRAEIKKAIFSMKDDKAGIRHGIPAEAIKADLQTAVEILHSLFTKIWEEENIPE